MDTHQRVRSEIGIMLPKIQRITASFDAREADDLAQEVAMKLLKSAPTIAQLRSNAWLGRGVRNAACDHFRKLKRHRKYASQSLTVDLHGAVRERGQCDGPVYLLPAAKDVHEDMERWLTSNARDALKNLPFEQRRALVLHVSGFDYAEIAEMTGSKLGTVRSRIHYAKEKLRQQVQ